MPIQFPIIFLYRKKLSKDRFQTEVRSKKWIQLAVLRIKPGKEDREGRSPAQPA
jgi:hypothetical protein